MSLAPRRASWSPTTALSSATKPPQSNLRLDQPGARYHSLEQLATRQTGDCLKCFRFSLDKQRWVEFLVTLERRGKVSLGESGPIRTALDLGAGTGGFLAALADRGVQGLGFSRNWGGLPYLETAAARGVLVVHLDFRRHIPMSPGAVDLLHCAWLMNVLSEREELEAMLMEWDRVVRPGAVRRGGLPLPQPAGVPQRGADYCGGEHLPAVGAPAVERPPAVGLWAPWHAAVHLPEAPPAPNFGGVLQAKGGQRGGVASSFPWERGTHPCFW